jgi:hypothetical protein
MDSKKYIGYVALDIADTMWPSGLCRVARKLGPLACSRPRFLPIAMTSLLDIVFEG